MRYQPTLILIAMNKLKLIFILTILFCIFSCEKKLNNQKEEGEVYSILIDKMAIAFPIPPPPPKDGSTPKKLNVDSISKVRVKLVVDTVMFETKRSIEIPKKYQDFEKLNKKLSGLKKKDVSKKYIESKKGHYLTFGNSIYDLKIKYSQIVGISRIAFNEDYTKAALYAYHSTGKLSGHTDFYLLEKREGKWTIIYKKNVGKT